MTKKLQLGSETKGVGLPWRLFLFSILVLVAVIVLYLGLEFGYSAFLSSQIKDRDQAILELTQSISQDDQNQFINFYSQLANMKTLLDDHVVASKTFPFLERNTNQLVFFNLVDLRADQRRLNLEGVAVNYEIFSQQLEAFNRAPEVERLVVNESQSREGRVTFRLFLILKPELFK